MKTKLTILIGLLALNSFAGSITLGWNYDVASYGITNYNILMSTNGTTYTSKFAAGNTNQITISGLGSGTYWFAANADSALGESTNSLPVEANITETAIPPTGLRVITVTIP